MSDTSSRSRRVVQFAAGFLLLLTAGYIVALVALAVAP